MFSPGSKPSKQASKPVLFKASQKPPKYITRQLAVNAETGHKKQYSNVTQLVSPSAFTATDIQFLSQKVHDNI